MSAFGIHLHGDPDEISAKALPLLSASLLRLLEKAAKSVLRESSDDLWVIESLKLASIEASIKPRASFTDDGTYVMQVLSDGVKSLSENSLIPDGWDIAMLKEVLQLGKLTQRIKGAGALEVLTSTELAVPLNEEFRANVISAIADLPQSMGSVVGRIVAWKDKHGADELTILDELTNDRVKVFVADEDTLNIENHARSRVCVWGDLTRDHLGAKIRIDKDGFDILPGRIDVSHESILGLWASDSGIAVDSVKFQRRLRDGE